MSMSKSLMHGGDLSGAEAKYGKPEAGWLDLSTGINRIPYPVPDIGNEQWQRLPLATELNAVVEAARATYVVPETAGLVVAPGTQAIIQWLPRMRKPGSVAIVGPTYAEHTQAWRRAGHSVLEVHSIEDAGSADVVVVVNPNNPDGAETDVKKLLDTASKLAKRQGLLVVDEAFADVTPALSVIPQTPHPGLFVLRSLGKFFGLAGVRIGFGIGEDVVTSKLADALGPWAIGGPALSIAATALSDGDWQHETRSRLAEDAARLDTLLAPAGLVIEGGTDLFRLVSHNDAASVADKLGHAGILVRTFEDRPKLLRFGLPGPEEEWARLSKALK